MRHTVAFSPQASRDEARQVDGNAVFFASNGDNRDVGTLNAIHWVMLSSGLSGLGPTTAGACRPFLVNGKQRAACARQRADWALDFSSLAVHMVAPAGRRELANWWTHGALAAHASTLSFTRFTLQLLSQGAPPDLISAAQQAIADGLRHARLGFGMAGAYAATPVGPGALDVAGALDDLSPSGIARIVIHEGCIGGTIAALEATSSHEHATEPAAREVFRQITNDNVRNAELSWRFLRWIRERGAVDEDMLIGEFIDSCNRSRAAERTASRTQTTPLEKRLLAHGKLPAGLRSELFARAWDEAIMPTLRTFLRNSTPTESAAGELASTG